NEDREIKSKTCEEFNECEGRVRTATSFGLRRRKRSKKGFSTLERKRTTSPPPSSSSSLSPVGLQVFSSPPQQCPRSALSLSPPPPRMSTLTALLLLLLSSCFLNVARSDLASDRVALVALRSAIGGRLLRWNLTDPPCTWAGVICDQRREQVVELHFPGMGLSGSLPAGTIANLTQLQTISFRFNSLSGPIPPDLASLSQLRNLYLQGNSFSGELPAFLFALQNLVRLNLASNDLSGVIPPAFGNLTRLKTLFLEDNRFSGSIPDLNLTLDQFNVSSNQLTGTIPSKLSSMAQSAFAGNSLCGPPLKPCNATGTGTGSGNKLSGGAIAGIVIGSVIGLFLILLVLIILCRRKSRGRSEKPKSLESGPAKWTEAGIPQTREARSLGESKATSAVAISGDRSGNKTLVFFGKGTSASAAAFDLEDLLRASAEVLGKGTFGTTYKATLETGTTVAVKRLKDVSIGEAEFRERMREIGAVEHENLVGLRAYYYNKDERLLVYDYLPTGSLSALLHGNSVVGRTPLNWDTRCGIALGAARGIAHLHSGGTATSHGNIKSSNVLLTNSYEAQVSDFGLAHIAALTAPPNRVDGYRAPELTNSHKVSQKADVYSFGVLLLELLTGKAPTHSLLNEEGVDLPRWVQSVVKEEWTAEVFDVELLRYQDVEEDMVQLLQLAMHCTAQYPDKRPPMAQVVNKIEEICRSSMLQEQEEHSGSGDGSYSHQTSV
ncbi:probable inactive receptor kinase At3g02880, partial [Rhodamnia argentea]|uniref:Probable inactive receptor kinase At3g02880 n=1 Tax=Rhodamnia argentea TaxID=178133 RepID=A0A8B8PPP1_9MYRT